MRRAVWVALGIGLLAAAFWLLQEPGSAPSDDPGAEARQNTSAEAGEFAEGVDVADSVEADAIEREGVEEEPEDELADGTSLTAGDLHITVVHHSDGAPVPGAFVRLHFWEQANYYANARTVQVGEDGRLELPAVGTGRFLASLVRTDEGDAYVRGNLIPGKITEVELVLGEGAVVHGLVLDPDGQPVADAEIWVTNGGGGVEQAAIARSDARGRYRVEDIGSGHGVGARKSGFAPSLVPMIVASAGAEVEMDLYLTGPGGAVTGVVLGDDGAPVVDARVVVGPLDPDWSQMPNGEYGSGMPAQQTRTDEQGRFAVDGLAPGTVPLMVRAPGWALHEDTIELFADETARAEVRLVRGVTAHGQVFDAAGEPVAQARVDTTTFGIRGFQTRADHRGHYRIEDLPIDGFTLRAMAADGEGIHVEEELAAGPGGTVEWNPVLAGGLDLAIRVVDEHGQGREEMFVELQGIGDPEKGEEHHFAWESTDAEGRIVFPGCPDLTYTVEVRAKGGGIFAAVSRPGLRAGGKEVVIEVPTTTDASVLIAGRVLMEDGSPAGGATVLPSSGSGGSPILTVEAETGEFEIGPFPPGEFTLRAELPGYPVLSAGPQQLAAGERWEVGDLIFEPGGSIRFLADFGHTSPEARPRLRLMQGTVVRSPRPRWEEDFALATPVAAGEYQVWWDGDGVALGSAAVTVRRGEEALVHLRFEPGSSCMLRATLAEADQEEDANLRRLPYTLSDETGASFSGTLWRGGDPVFSREIHLASGSWTLKLDAGDGRTVEHRFAVSADAATPAVEVAVPARARD